MTPCSPRGRAGATEMAREFPPGTTLLGQQEVLSPMQQMPYELVLEIARLAQPESPEMDFRRPPLSLSQVSHRWRDVMLSSPEFWTTLSLCITRFGDIAGIGSKEIFDLWCSRLAASPLSLHMEIQYLGDDDDEEEEGQEEEGHENNEGEEGQREDQEEDQNEGEEDDQEADETDTLIFTSLEHIASHICRIRLEGNEIGFYPSLLWQGFEDWEFTALESCELINDPFAETTFVQFFPIPTRAPNLKRISLSRNGLIQAPQAIQRLSGFNLTNVTILEAFNVAAWYQMMLRWPNLTVGHFELCVTSPEWDTHISQQCSVQVKDLCRLRIGFEGVEDQTFVRLLSHFEMPALQHLIISLHERHEGTRPDINPHAFLDFRHITTLVLSDKYPNTSHLIDVLRESVCVDYVCLSASMTEDHFEDFNKALMWSDDKTTARSNILPKLSSLCLDFDYEGFREYKAFDVDRLLVMLKSRVGGDGIRLPGECVPLKRLRVASGPAYQEEHPLAMMKGAVEKDEVLRQRLVVEAVQEKLSKFPEEFHTWGSPWLV